MDTGIDFVKDPGGKITKAVLNDQRENYELIKTD